MVIKVKQALFPNSRQGEELLSPLCRKGMETKRAEATQGAHAGTSRRPALCLGTRRLHPHQKKQKST